MVGNMRGIQAQFNCMCYRWRCFEVKRSNMAQEIEGWQCVGRSSTVLLHVLEMARSNVAWELNGWQHVGRSRVVKTACARDGDILN